jgi:hypothetical protein
MICCIARATVCGVRCSARSGTVLLAGRLYGLNILVQCAKHPLFGPLPVLRSTIGTVGLIISAWYGGHLVYEEGMRVRGISPAADAPELKLPQDASIAAAFDRLGGAMREAGPQE